MTDIKPLIVCADDFAMDRSVSNAILGLVDADRVSAVSCFSDSPLWPESGAELGRRSDKVLIGLHFNLTHDFGHAKRSLPYWIAASSAGLLRSGPLRAALQRQLDRFAEVIGRYPDYVDGHEHVHAFPSIRDVVRVMAVDPSTGRPIPVRNLRKLVGPTDAPLKRAVIRGLAGIGRPARNCGPVLNSTFAGDYSMSVRANYARLFSSWLAASEPGGLVVCHPALPQHRPDAGARAAEYRFLDSAACAEMLVDHGIRLVRTGTGSPTGTTDHGLLVDQPTLH
jgi:predicted glycoside hydrolase/deacetylase ChbG (UPF0249 family)